MDSSGLLLLLILASSIPATHQKSTADPNKTPIRDNLEKVGKFYLKNAGAIKIIITPFVSLIPVAGPFIASILDLGASLSQEGDLKEFQSLQLQIRELSQQIQVSDWDETFRESEKKIDIAWRNLESLVESCKKEEEKMNAQRKFIQCNSNNMEGFSHLHHDLTVKSPSTPSNLADILAVKFKCHEQHMNAASLHLKMLLWKGMVLNNIYDHLTERNTEAEVNKVVSQYYEAIKALVGSQRKCITDNSKYIQQDVENQIEESKDIKKHQEVANKVQQFLSNKYDRYDWTAVAFKTKNSKGKAKILKNHFLSSGFQQVDGTEVSVGVAKQMKGTHTKQGDVGQAITNCLGSHPEITKRCYNLEKAFSKCTLTSPKIPLTSTYTALHAYKRRRSNEATSADKVLTPEEMDDALLADSSFAPDTTTAYFYEGGCNSVLPSHFTVLIKSDEELEGKDRCLGELCSSHGTCETLPGTLVWVCNCNDGYYGEHCEEELDVYKKEMLAAAAVKLAKIEATKPEEKYTCTLM